MPQLIKSVEGIIHSTPISEVIYVKSVTGEIQREDYINLNGFVAYLQNFSKTEVTQLLTKPITYGLVNQYNLQIETIEISY